MSRKGNNIRKKMAIINIDNPGAPMPASTGPEPLKNAFGQPLIPEVRKEIPIDNPGSPRYVTTYTDPSIFQYREMIANLQREVDRLRYEAAAKVKIPPQDNFSGVYEMVSDSGNPKIVSPQFNIPHQRRNMVSYWNTTMLCEIFPIRPPETWNREIVRFLMAPLMPNLDDLEFERIYDSPGEVRDRMAGIVQTVKRFWALMLFVIQEKKFDEKTFGEYRDLVARLCPDNTTLSANNDDCVIFDYTGTLCDNAMILYGLERQFQGRAILLLLARINFIAELLYQHPFVQDLPAQRVIAFMNALRDCNWNDVEAVAVNFLQDAVKTWQDQANVPQEGTALTPSPEMMQVLDFLSKNPEGVSGKVLMDLAGYSSKSKFHKTVLDALVEKGLLGLALKDKPSSPQQKYLLTEAGGAVLRQFGTVPVSIIPCGTVPASVPTVPSSDSGCSV